MLRRNLRVFLLISVLVILSIVILGYRDIDLPGDSLDRGGTGPLGLVLGLDLRGGAHLVYQAESPVRIDVTFEEPLSEEELQAALTDLGFGTTSITTFAREEFSLDVPDLSQGEVELFLKDLAEELGVIREFNIEIEARTSLDIRLADAPNEASVTEVIDGLGYPDATVAAVLSQIFTVTNLPSLDVEAETAMREALEGLFSLDALQVGEVDDETQAIIFFTPLPDGVDIESALNDLGYPGSRVVNLDGKTFTTTVASLDEQALADLRAGLRDDVIGIDQISATDIEAALIDLVFEVGLDQGVVETALTDLGFPEATVTESRGADYAIDLPSLDEERDLTIEDELVEQLGAVSSFRFQRNNPTEESMEGVVDTIERRINAFGITEPTVQRFGDDRVLIQLPGVEDTRIDLAFKGNVSQGTLESTLRDLGFDDAIVDRPRQVVVSNLFNIDIAGLSQESREKIRRGLEDKFGLLGSFSFDEATERIQVAFQQGIAVADLRTTLSDLDFASAEVSQGTGSSFRVRTPTLTTVEQEQLRLDLANSILPIESFEASGGVEEAKGLIGQTAQLVFKERTCLNADCSEFTDRDAVGRSGESLTGDNLVQAFAGTQPTTGLPIVNFVFDGEGTRIFRDLTTRISGDRTKCIAHILDDELIICPVVNRPIVSGSGFIEGPDFTFDRVRNLAIQLQSGSLPVSLELVRESTVDSLLGDESLKASLKAAIVGLALIIFFLVAYYRMAGVVASAALMVYGVIILAIFKMVPVTLTLSGLAGLILSFGMAVDANILIFERLKEELRTGRSLLSSMEIGFRRAWPAIRDSNTSTFITTGILFFFGRELGEPRITGFAITLAIGVAVSMFTALTVTRNILQLMAFTRLGRVLNLFSPEGARRSVSVAGGDK